MLMYVKLMYVNVVPSASQTRHSFSSIGMLLISDCCVATGHSKLCCLKIHIYIYIQPYIANIFLQLVATQEITSRRREGPRDLWEICRSKTWEIWEPWALAAMRWFPGRIGWIAGGHCWSSIPPKNAEKPGWFSRYSNLREFWWTSQTNQPWGCPTNPNLVG